MQSRLRSPTRLEQGQICRSRSRKDYSSRSSRNHRFPNNTQPHKLIRLQELLVPRPTCLSSMDRDQKSDRSDKGQMKTNQSAPIQDFEFWKLGTDLSQIQ